MAKPLGLILVVGLVVQVALAFYAHDDAAAADVIRNSQLVILAFYAGVLAVVVRMARGVDFLPLWSKGATAENAAVGAFKGVAAATVVLMLVSLAVGRVQVAPSVKFQLGDATLANVLLAALVLVVAAPLVEELLFRGFVAEAMRHRGQVVALVVSGVLFALWHMQIDAVQIAYYTVLGVLLGRTYWKRGLVASMAAHAGFNGTLALVAVAFILGPGATLSANGVTVQAPGGWDKVDVPARGGGFETVFAAHGPSQSVFVVVRMDLGVPSTASRDDGLLRKEYPAGTAVRVYDESERSELAMFQRGTTTWVVGLKHPSPRTRDDFEEMLETLQLPA